VPTATADTLADRLQILARLVQTIPVLAPCNRVETSVGIEPERDVLNVHGCTPGQLDDLQVVYPAATAHRDQDEILRWLSVDLNGADVTFFRR